MSKLTNRVFGRRFWAVLVAIIMVVQLLPVAAIADYVEQTDEDGAIVDFVSNRGYDGGIEVDTVEPAKGEGTVAPIGNAGGSFEGGEEIDPILPVVPVTGDEEPEEPADPAEPEEPAEEPEEPEEPAEEPEEPVEPEEPEEPAEEPEEPAEEPAQAESFTVAFAAEDGTALLTVEVEPGQAIGELPEAPAKYGYTFLGWFDANGNKVTAETVVYGTMVVTARYEMNMPMQGFSATTSTGIKVYAFADEGVFPAGTTMRVQDLGTPVALNLAREMYGDNVTDAAAVDITFFDENGNEVQPIDQQKVLVRIVLNRELEGENFNVVHFDEKGTFTEVGKANASNASFETGSFSIYIVVATGEDARLKVVFHRADGTTSEQWINKRQLDKINQYIFDPGAATPEGAFFKGWTTEEEYTAATTAMTIADVRKDITQILNEGITDGTTVDYYAMVFDSYVITYLDEDGITIKNDQVLFPVNSETSHQYTVSLTYVPKSAYDPVSGASREFGGWQQLSPEVPGEMVIYQNDEPFELSTDVILKATINTGYWLSFDANLNNATFTGPVFAAFENGQPGKPERPSPDPTCPGYTFVGWYTGTPKGNGQIEDAVLFDFNQPLTETMKVYGMWTVNTTARYNVIIWQQNLDGETYDYKETITVNNHTVGTNTYQITKTNSDATARIYTSNTQYTDKSYTGFHVGTIDAQKAVQANNTTVINVYFDRNEHTLTFRQSRTGTVYQTITALYGQNIKDYFPITANGAQTTWRWSPQNSTTFNQVLVYIDVMPDEDVVFYRDQSSYSTKTIHYMIEALPGQTATRTYNGTGFVEYAEVDASYNFFTEAEDYINLDGFVKGTASTPRYQPQAYSNNNGNYPVNNPSATGNNVWGTSYRHVFVYYIRELYTIEYEDGTFFELQWDGAKKEVPLVDPPVSQNITTKTGIKYQSDINNDTYKFTPTKTEYVFAGWYKDVNCMEAYTFNTMPSHNFKLYAKWLAKVYNVRLVPNDSTDDPIRFVDSTQSRNFYVDCNELIADMSGAERNYWDLVGWYTDAEFTHAYDFAVIPINDDYVRQWGNPDYRESDWEATYGQVTLYARWRNKLIGSDGIKVEYDITEEGKEGTAPTDNSKYVDLAEAIAASACAPNDEETYVFSHWSVQHWNGSAYEDSGVNVYPGETFDVKIDDAKIINTDTNTVVPRNQYNSLDPNAHYSYTVVLKANYIEKEKAVKTHIYWYMNNGTDAYKKYEDIAINQAVDIPAAPTRTGYVFRGWARINIGSTPEAAAAWEVNSANWTQSTKTLYIVYTGTGYTDANGNPATQVAADEHTPYHAMFAVWDPILTVEIKGNTATKTYNGSEQKAEGFTVVYKLAGEEVEAPDGVTVALKDGSKAEAKGTDVATYPMGLTKDDFTVTVAENAGIVFDATDENSVTVTDGNLTIEPAKVTITAKDASRAYNGEALTQPEFTVTGLAEGDTHEFAVVMTEDSTITNVGTQPNVIATVDGVAVTTGTETAVGNYLVTTADGTLTITPNTDEV
ncbi:MAG: InlB B-repeat-containing protein, partial [Clostridia bacterium]|nr:InlB B-repeat-containing protein [Clostridia bacterium]